MRENRTTYPKRKTQIYQQLQELPSKYKVLALVRMEKIRASQILPLRKKLKDEVEFVSIKDTIATGHQVFKSDLSGDARGKGPNYQRDPGRC